MLFRPNPSLQPSPQPSASILTYLSSTTQRTTKATTTLRIIIITFCHVWDGVIQTRRKQSRHIIFYVTCRGCYKSIYRAFLEEAQVSCHGDDFLAGGSQGGSEADRPPLPGPQGVLGGRREGDFLCPRQRGLFFLYYLLYFPFSSIIYHY